MVSTLSSPFDALFAFQRALEASLASGWLGAGTAGSGSFPPINVFQQGDDLVAVMELPGVDKDNLHMAETLIERISGKFDRGMFEDRYQEALHKLVAAKQKGKKIVFAEEPERDSNVVDITEALKASLRGASKGEGARAAPKRRPAARSKSTRKRGKRAA